MDNPSCKAKGLNLVEIMKSAGWSIVILREIL